MKTLTNWQVGFGRNDIKWQMAMLSCSKSIDSERRHGRKYKLITKMLPEFDKRSQIKELDKIKKNQRLVVQLIQCSIGQTRNEKDMEESGLLKSMDKLQDMDDSVNPAFRCCDKLVLMIILLMVFSVAAVLC
ncbi:hypothetical protein Tco_0261399 [Tanacetum coccineum]